MSVLILPGNCLMILKTLPNESVNCCVTSPPYWGLRDYGCEGQCGLEKPPQEYVEKMVAVFSEVRRVLREDGTLWLNLGDSYAASLSYQVPDGKNLACDEHHKGSHKVPEGLKPKDLCGIPWRVAFALQADGWYLRQDIIWAKPNPMPESVTDRCTKSHEYIFLLSKSERYYYDAKAIAEPATGWRGSKFDDGKNLEVHPNVGKRSKGKWSHEAEQSSGRRITDRVAEARANGAAHDSPFGETRNKRDVWTVPTKAYKDSRFATFQPALIRPCILAGSPTGGTVLDPFGGSGTTGMVAEQEGRNSILIELNPKYVELIKHRTQQQGLFCNPTGDAP